MGSKAREGEIVKTVLGAVQNQHLATSNQKHKPTYIL